ncbi:dihydrodipicolinate synthase family protein [Fusibacter sp. JL298sf-3]
MLERYTGVWPTMVAAFDETAAVDLEANAQLTEYLIQKGADGLFAVCQSSEMFFLSTAEKVALAKTVVETAAGRVPVIASGHTSDTLEAQIEELRAVAATGVDAVVLVSNRLATETEDSAVFLERLEAIMNALPEVTFGIYECPYPYRRLLTDRELKWCADSGRIIFLKDVSCDASIQKRRAEIVKGSPLKLFNANTETLLTSLRNGYHGYNGVMGNFHIDLYKWLFTNHCADPLKAEALQAALTRESAIEKFAYPANAKYHMVQDGVSMTTVGRKYAPEVLDDAAKQRVGDLMAWEQETRQTLGL